MASLARASRRIALLSFNSVKASAGVLAPTAIRRFAASAGPANGSSAQTSGSLAPGKAAAAFGFAVAGLGLFVGSATLDNPDADLWRIRQEIEALVEEGHGPLFVRLAWHTSGTFCKASRTGGSEGATMRFCPESDWGANAGLGLARDLLEPIKARHPDLSYADMWTLAGCVAVEYMGGPAVPWRKGRTDYTDGSKCPADGRLPNADMGSIGKTVQHIRDIFRRMGFNDKEIVALCGAHALGRCHVDRSGYWGPWTRAETTFSNAYFTELLENTWTLKQWDGPEQFEDPTGELMMLPSDMALIWDKTFRRHVANYADDEEQFFKDFAKAFSKLMELGVPHLNRKPWYKPWLFLMA